MANAATIAQILMSGLLMGLIYALIAAGLSLIFGLMDVVNFAHGEFLMTAMYATFGLAIVIRGLAQFVFTPDYRSIPKSWLGGQTFSIFGVYMPAPQLAGALASLLAFGALWLLMKRTDFGKALEATREDAGAVGLVGIDRNRVFAMGWGLGAALVGLAGAILSIFYYIHPDVGGPFALIAYVTVALGGFGSVFGALAAGVIVGIVEAISATVLQPSMKAIGIY